MSNTVDSKELRLLQDLHKGGIPIDEALLKEREAAFRGIIVRQTGCAVDNAIFDRGYDETCYLLSLAVTNTSDRNIRLQACRLEIPWAEWNFHWLPNPLAKIPREYDYADPAIGPAGFDPEVVLNHRFGEGCTLTPGESMQGFLIGAGESRVPGKYANRRGIRMRLTVFDGKGNPSPLDVILGVQRSEPRKSPWSTQTPVPANPPTRERNLEPIPTGTESEQPENAAAAPRNNPGQQREPEFAK